MVTSVPVGTNPVALASGHGSLWVLNGGDDTVSQVNPTSHALGQVLDVGHDPQSLAVTGDDLWVANFSDGTVTRINLLAAKVVATVHVGSGPAAIAAGPAGLWVANSGDNTIRRIDPRTGAPGVPVDVGDGPDGLAVDGTSVWVSNGRAGSVTRIEARTRQQMSAPIRVGTGPRGIVRDGDDVWVADELSQTVTRIDVPTQHTHSIEVGDGPSAVAIHRGALWVTEKYSGDLIRIDPDTEKKTRLDARGAVRGLAVAHGHMWVSSGAVASIAHRGGTLRIAADALPGAMTGLDPARVYDRTAWLATRGVYDGLLAWHYSGGDPQVLVPDLATSVPEPTDSGRTYTFNLRPGIRYSTGELVKASDLVRGLHRALFAARPDYYAGVIGGQTCIDHHSSCDLSRGVVADDAERRVTFHLRAPDAEFLYKLTLLVVPAPVGTALGRLTSPLPSTGPYRITKYTQGKRLTLARNPFFHEWSAGAQPAGFVDGFTWIKVASARAAANTVTEGRADLAELTPLGELGTENGFSRQRAQDRGTDPGPQQPLARHVVRGPQLLDTAVRPAQGARGVQLRGRSQEGRADHGWSERGSRSLPAPPRQRAVVHPHCPYTTGRPFGAYRGPDLAKGRALVRASGTLGMKVTVTDLLDAFSTPLESYFVDVLRQLGYRATLRQLADNARNESACTPTPATAASRSRRAAAWPTSPCRRTSTTSSHATGSGFPTGGPRQVAGPKSRGGDVHAADGSRCGAPGRDRHQPRRDRPGRYRAGGERCELVGHVQRVGNYQGGVRRTSGR